MFLSQVEKGLLFTALQYPWDRSSDIKETYSYSIAEYFEIKYQVVNEEEHRIFGHQTVPEVLWEHFMAC